MNGGRLSSKNLFFARRVLSSEVRSAQRYATPASLPFRIPEPIERSPTDLLEALSETVGIDVTASHFSFIDDPTMIPTSLNKKRHYYLCKEFGKRAARQLAEEWPTLFMFDRDQPRLPVFRPEKPLDPLVVEADEANLLKMIANNRVEDAVQLYNRICDSKIDLSDQARLKLFFLTCYYNGKNVPINEVAEWHGLRNFHEVIIPENKASEDSIVERLFLKVEKSADVYSAMICNLCKFSTQVSLIRAKELFFEMQKKKFKPAVEVFNYFLQHNISIIPKNNANNFNVANELKEMAQLGVMPTVRTFNSALLAASKIEDSHKGWKLAKGLIAEMEACRIPPNLTTYDRLITVANRGNDLGFSLGLLESILNILELADTIELTEITDSKFFLNAIQLADNARNAEMVDRIEKLYQAKKNHVQFGSFTTEADFYAIYLISKFNVLRIDEFEDVYVSNIPRIASLNVVLANRIIGKLERFPVWSFIRRIIEDCIAIGHGTHDFMVRDWQRILLNYPVEKLSEDELDQYKELCTKLILMWKDFNDLAEFKFDRKMSKTEDSRKQKNESEAKETEPLDENTESKKRPLVKVDYEHFMEEMVKRNIVKPLI